MKNLTKILFVYVFFWQTPSLGPIKMSSIKEDLKLEQMLS